PLDARGNRSGDFFGKPASRYVSSHGGFWPLSEVLGCYYEVGFLAMNRPNPKLGAGLASDPLRTLPVMQVHSRLRRLMGAFMKGFAAAFYFFCAPAVARTCG